MYLFQQVEEAFMLYDDSKKKVAEFILQKRSKLTNYSMQEIAEATYTSKPTLVRFAQALAYAGWKEFMKAFAEEAYYQESHFSDIDPNYPFSMSDSTKDIIAKVSDLQVESILDTADLLPMIGITSGGNNYIRENIDCILTISSRERLFSKISGFSTEASILNILNILFSCCFVRNYEKNLEYKIKNSKNFEFRRRASLVDMREDEA